MKLGRRGGDGQVDDGGESDDARRKREIRETLERHRNEGSSSQAQAVEHLLIAEPTQSTTDWLWRILVGGLMAALIVTLGGLVALAFLGKSNQVLVTVFSSMLTGLLGLFIKDPSG